MKERKSVKPSKTVTSTVAQASALGAALSIHHHWNKKTLPDNVIDLKLFPVLDAVQVSKIK